VGLPLVGGGSNKGAYHLIPRRTERSKGGRHAKSHKGFGGVKKDSKRSSRSLGRGAHTTPIDIRVRALLLEKQSDPHLVFKIKKDITIGGISFNIDMKKKKKPSSCRYPNKPHPPLPCRGEDGRRRRNWKEYSNPYKKKVESAPDHRLSKGPPIPTKGGSRGGC